MIMRMINHPGIDYNDCDFVEFCLFFGKKKPTGDDCVEVVIECC